VRAPLLCISPLHQKKKNTEVQVRRGHSAGVVGRPKEAHRLRDTRLARLMLGEIPRMQGGSLEHLFTMAGWGSGSGGEQLVQVELGATVLPDSDSWDGDYEENVEQNIDDTEERELLSEARRSDLFSFGVSHDVNSDIGGGVGHLSRSPASSEQIAALNSTKTRLICAKNDQCPICLSNLETGTDSLLTTGCRHCFHNNCLKPWLQTANTCPLCRLELTRMPQLEAADNTPRPVPWGLDLLQANAFCVGISDPATNELLRYTNRRMHRQHPKQTWWSRSSVRSSRATGAYDYRAPSSRASRSRSAEGTPTAAQRRLQI
jgi:hypothetical protein